MGSFSLKYLRLFLGTLVIFLYINMDKCSIAKENFDPYYTDLQRHQHLGIIFNLTKKGRLAEEDAVAGLRPGSFPYRPGGSTWVRFKRAECNDKLDSYNILEECDHSSSYYIEDPTIIRSCDTPGESGRVRIYQRRKGKVEILFPVDTNTDGEFFSEIQYVDVIYDYWYWKLPDEEKKKVKIPKGQLKEANFNLSVGTIVKEALQ